MKLTIINDNFPENATKFCNSNSQWEKTEFTYCLNASSNSLSTHDDEYNTWVYYCIGYTFSIFALSIALIIFLHFK